MKSDVPQNNLETNKAVGIDSIPAEALIAGGGTVIDVMKSIIDNIWKIGDWSDEWVISEIVTMANVAGSQECSKHRTLGLISHALKILL